jgi:alkylation response protein AidB-like acyl-CoA dehydrogenase
LTAAIRRSTIARVMGLATETPGDVLDAVNGLTPAIRARAEEIEAARCLPADLAEDLRSAGVFRMLTPASHGGGQVGLVRSMEVLEAISVADGATGWTTMIGAESPQLLALLPRATYEALYAVGPDVTVGGSFVPLGEAHVVEGGYRVHGRWPFASGCQRWDLLFGNCVVVRDGTPEMRPDGIPATRAMLLDAGQTDIEDTWKVLGLRGTGSQHFSLAETFVPEERTFDIYFGRPSIEGVSPFPIIDFICHIGTVAVGIARAALDDVVGRAGSRVRLNMRAPLAETPLVQHRLGRADIALRAARTLLYAEAGRLERQGYGEDFLALAVRTWATTAWIAATARDVVDTCFQVNGASGIYDGAALQRMLRDIHTITQHAALNDNSITRAGAALLGRPVDMTF